jgi:hypothetical protein
MIDTKRSHSEVIRTCGVDVPDYAQDYDSQAYLDWIGTVNLNPPAVIFSEDLQVVTVVDEAGGYEYQIVRRVWRR